MAYPGALGGADDVLTFGLASKIHPTIQSLTASIANTPNATDNKTFVQNARELKLSASDQLLTQYQENQAKADQLRNLATDYQSKAVGYVDPRVDQVWNDLASVQASAPSIPVPSKAADATPAQRFMAMVAGLINPRQALTYFSMPDQFQEAEAHKQDQLNRANYDAAEKGFEAKLARLNTMLGIAQRGETSKRQTYAGLATSTMADAIKQDTLAGNTIKNYMAALNQDIESGLKDEQFGAKMEFEKDKAGNLLAFNQKKLEAWVNQRQAALEEQTRYHTGVLADRDRNAALGWAKLEAAERMNSYIRAQGNEKLKQQAFELQMKLRSEGEQFLARYDGPIRDLQEKQGKIDAAIMMLNSQIQDGMANNTLKAPDLAKLQSQLAAQIEMKKMYSRLISDAQKKIQDKLMAAGAPPTNVPGSSGVVVDNDGNIVDPSGNPVGGNLFGGETPTGKITPGGVRPGSNPTKDGSLPKAEAYYGSQDQGGAKPPQSPPGKQAPSTVKPDGQVGTRGGNVKYRIKRSN